MGENSIVYDNPRNERDFRIFRLGMIALPILGIIVAIALWHIIYFLSSVLVAAVFIAIHWAEDYYRRPCKVRVCDDHMELLFSRGRRKFLMFRDIEGIWISPNDRTIAPALIKPSGISLYRVSKEIARETTRRYTICMGRPPPEY